MPRGPAPAWRQRKPPILDDWILASISRANGKPDDDGHYAPLVVSGCTTRAEATDYVRALHRCARYLCKYSEHQIGIHATVVRNGNRYRVEWSAVDKVAAKKYVLEKYGPDRSKWPYDPRRRAS